MPGKERKHQAPAADDDGDEADAVEATSIVTDKGTFNLGPIIGKGGFGVVYQGLHVEGGNFVAIKQVKLQSVPKDEIKSIMAEIDLLRSLKHPKIVRYITYLATKSTLSIVMEYVENGSLLRILKKFGSLPENLVAVYISQVLEGLVFLHQQGVVHRDIKGANILVTKTGDIKIADFGIASKLNDQSDSETAMGTPYWMAPEIIELNGASCASDVWSVGCTVIELLVGHPPYFDLAPMTALYRIVQEDHPPLPESVSSNCVDWLLCVFKKDPDQRPSAAKLLNHRWLKEARSAQAASKKNLGISDGPSVPATASPARQPSITEKKPKSAVAVDDLMAELNVGGDLGLPTVPGMEKPAASASAAPAPSKDDDFDLDGVDLSGLEEIAAASEPRKMSANSLLNSLQVRTEEQPDASSLLDDLDFGDVSDLKINTFSDTPAPAAVPSTKSPTDDDDLSSLLSCLPDSSCYSESSSKLSQSGSAPQLQGTSAAPATAAAAPASTQSATQEEDNWGDDFVGGFGTLHVKKMTDADVPAFDDHAFAAPAPVPAAAAHDKKIKTPAVPKKAPETEEEDWDADLQVPSQKLTLHLPGVTRTPSHQAPVMSKTLQKSSPKSSSPTNSPSSGARNRLTENIMQRHKRTVSEMVHDENWNADFVVKGSENMRLKLHVTSDAAAATSLDSLPDVPQAEGAAPVLKTSLEGIPKPLVISPQSVSASGLVRGTQIPHGIPLFGSVTRIGNGTNVVTEISDEDWVVNGKKAGESVQLQAKPMRDLDLDMDDALFEGSESSDFDDSFWGDDKEEDKDAENRRNENTKLERKLSSVFSTLLENAPSLPPAATVVKLLHEATVEIEEHSMSLNAAFRQLGFAPIIDLLGFIFSGTEKLRGSKSSEAALSGDEEKMNKMLQAALHFLEKTFAFSAEQVPLEMMFHQADGFHVLLTYMNAPNTSQTDLHTLVQFVATLSPNALSIFAGCGGIFALRRLLRCLNKKDCSGLLLVLETVIRIYSLDDQKPNNDMSRSLVRANIHNEVLNVAEQHIGNTGNKESVDICNKVGQLFQSLSRREDANVKRAMSGFETAKTIVKLLQAPDDKKSPFPQTLRRDLVKSMRHICVSDVSNVKNLFKAGAIKVLVDQYPQNPNLQVHILAVLSRCCRFDEKCMKEAVKEGIIPHLLKTGTDRVLKEDTVPLFLAMVRRSFASKKMLECGVLQYFVDLLHDRAFLDSALNALALWAKREKKKITHPLAEPKAVKSIVWAVENGNNDILLEHLKNLLDTSKSLSKTVLKETQIIPVLLTKLKSSHSSPNAKLNALHSLSRLCKLSSAKSSLASQYSLVSELTAIRKEMSGAMIAVGIIDDILSFF